MRISQALQHLWDAHELLEDIYNDRSYAKGRVDAHIAEALSEVSDAIDELEKIQQRGGKDDKTMGS